LDRSWLGLLKRVKIPEVDDGVAAAASTAETAILVEVEGHTGNTAHSQ
jgi:hypothetical protein